MPILYTWIYLIYDPNSGFYKIGKSDDPDRRLAELCRELTLLPRPHEFEIEEAWLAKPADERMWHERFAEYRQRGEWFELGHDHIYQMESHYRLHQRFVAGAVLAEDEGIWEINSLELKIERLEKENAGLRDQNRFLMQEAMASRGVLV